MRAILQHRARTAPLTDALLIYSARTWEELIFRDELLRADADDPHFRLVLSITREGRRRPTDYERRLDRVALREILAGWRARPELTYVCGSTPFVETVANALVDEGVDAERVRTERYGGVS